MTFLNVYTDLIDRRGYSICGSDGFYWRDLDFESFDDVIVGLFAVYCPVGLL